MIDIDEFFDSADEATLERISNSLMLKPGEQLSKSLVRDIVTPVHIGPTWERNEDGSWKLPERTLGWQIAGWATKWLRDPNNPKKRWIFTDEQLRFTLWWYAVDENGEFVYRKGVLQRRKGWGKDPLLAVFCLVEMVGPCRFGGWDEEGRPIGTQCPNSLVQVSAVVQAQTTNTSDMFNLLMSPEFIAHYDVKPGIELVRAFGGTRQIQMVTGSYRALEGKRATFALLNETHHWVAGNGGIKIYETIDGNASKISGNRFLAITNAYVPGDAGGSAAEIMRQAWMKDLEPGAPDTGWLYDSVEAHERAPLGGPLAPLIVERMIGDGTWTKVEDVLSSINSMPPERSRRMWYNQVVTDSDQLFTPQEIADATQEAVLSRGDMIVLGLDGGLTDDSTALVAVRIADMQAFILGCWGRWEKDGYDGYRVDQDEVSNQVDIAMASYEVVGFFSDVANWETYVTKWTELYAEKMLVKAKQTSPIGLDMRGSLERLTRANERLIDAIQKKAVKLDDDFRFRKHLMNVRRRNNRWGVSFGKESRESRQKVDIYAALLLAYEAAIEYKTKHAATKKKIYGSGGYFF